jgi:hypothetical protein
MTSLEKIFNKCEEYNIFPNLDETFCYTPKRITKYSNKYIGSIYSETDINEIAECISEEGSCMLSYVIESKENKEIKITNIFISLLIEYGFDPYINDNNSINIIITDKDILNGDSDYEDDEDEEDDDYEDDEDEEDDDYEYEDDEDDDGENEDENEDDENVENEVNNEVNDGEVENVENEVKNEVNDGEVDEDGENEVNEDNDGEVEDVENEVNEDNDGEVEDVENEVNENDDGEVEDVENEVNEGENEVNDGENEVNDGENTVNEEDVENEVNDGEDEVEDEEETEDDNIQDAFEKLKYISTLTKVQLLNLLLDNKVYEYKNKNIRKLNKTDLQDCARENIESIKKI